MILMYFSQANKALVRVLDACLGEGVMAFMPAPPFFPVAAWLATDPLYML